MDHSAVTMLASFCGVAFFISVYIYCFVIKFTTSLKVVSTFRKLSHSFHNSVAKIVQYQSCCELAVTEHSVNECLPQCLHQPHRVSCRRLFVVLKWTKSNRWASRGGTCHSTTQLATPMVGCAAQSKYAELWFLPCDAMRCTVLVIVILSVRLSHSCTVSTWFNLRSWFLHHMVAPPF